MLKIAKYGNFHNFGGNYTPKYNIHFSIGAFEAWSTNQESKGLQFS